MKDGRNERILYLEFFFINITHAKIYEFMCMSVTQSRDRGRITPTNFLTQRSAGEGTVRS